MPNIIDIPDRGPSIDLATADFPEYQAAYGGVDLKPGSRTHEMLKRAILHRARESRNVMQRRFATWKEIDRTMTAYVPLDDYEKAVKKKDSRKPVSIVVPVSFAVKQTLLSYLMQAFLEEPYLRYEGMAPEDSFGALLLEMLITQQCRVSKVPLSLVTKLGDGLQYGFGVAHTVWNKKMGKKTVLQPTGFISEVDGTFVQTGEERVSQPALQFEGNKLENIDPYNYLPDPNVPVERVQDGEFVGWVVRTNRMSLLNREAYNDEGLFNCKYLRYIDGRSQLYNETDTGRTDRFGAGGNWDPKNTTNPVDLIVMYVNLVPREWELGPSEYPEKWLFMLAGEEVIIRAQPLNLDHDMFPIIVYAPNADGYGTAPISQLEVIYGLQNAEDFWISSRMTNVRKSLNDMLVVDPQLIYMKDLENPQPGKLIRLRPSAFGKGVKDAVMPLPVQDVTANNIQDATFVFDMIKAITGATDNIQGIMRSGGERRSATESRDTRMSALSRVGQLAMMASLQSMYDLGYLFARHTQQLQTMPTYVKATGTWRDVLMQEYGILDSRVLVEPSMLMVDYDVVIKDSSLPGAEYADTWTQLLQMIMSSPFAPMFDVARIFKHIARLLGAKNINDFIIANPMQISMQNQVMIDKQVQAGNLVPANEIGGTNGTSGTGTPDGLGQGLGGDIP